MQNEQLQDYNEPLRVQLKELAQPTNDSLSINPNKPHWNWWTAFALWGASVALIIIVPGIALAFYAISTGKITDPETLAVSPEAILVNIIAVLPAHLLTLVLAWVIITKSGKIPFREMLGWKMGRFKVIYLFLIVIGFFALSIILSSIIPEQDNDLLRILRSSRSAVIAIALIATFTAPLVEEVVYRGVMYSAALKEFGQTQAIICSTAYFALVHVPQYYPSFSTIFIILLLSLVLTLIRAKSNSLLPCIVLHTIFNGIQSILMIAQPYLEKYIPSESNKSALIFWFN